MPQGLTSCGGNTLFFSADDGKHGTELWKCTVPGNATMVKDIYAGGHPGANSNPQGFTCCWSGGRMLLFFAASTYWNGQELWVSDGTSAGTRLVKDIWPLHTSSNPTRITACDGRVFFFADDGKHGRELWVSDGTSQGTRMVKDIRAGPASGIGYSREMVSLFGKVFFPGNDTTYGDELWISDGTPSGTALLFDYGGSTRFGRPISLLRHGNRLAATIYDQIWLSDGTTRGTSVFSKARGASVGYTAASCGNRIFCEGRSAVGREPWVTDGTAVGTFLLKDIFPGVSRVYGPLSSLPYGWTCSDGKMFFLVQSPRFTMWASDGTPQGTISLEAAAGTTVGPLFGAGRGVYFAAMGGGNGHELWFSDGTVAGTRQVCDINKGPGSSWPSDVAICGGRMFFVADDGAKGAELWVMDNPGATKEILGQGSAPGAPILDASNNPVVGRPLTIRADGGPKGWLGFLGVSSPVAQPGPVPASPRATNWLDLRSTVVLGPFQGPSFSIPVKSVASAMAGLKLTCQVWWVNPAQGLPAYSVSNGLLLTPGN